MSRSPTPIHGSPQRRHPDEIDTPRDQGVSGWVVSDTPPSPGPKKSLCSRRIEVVEREESTKRAGRQKFMCKNSKPRLIGDL